MRLMNTEEKKRQAPNQGSGLDPKAVILERKTSSSDDCHQRKIYDLRLLAASYLDGSAGSQESAFRSKMSGKFPAVDVRSWEEGRHNPLGTNIQIQAKSLAFYQPSVTWQFVEEEVSAVREAWTLSYFRKQKYAEMFRLALQDMLISGQGTIQGGVRDGDVYLEYCDALDVQWDQAYHEPHLRRYVFRARRMPASEAVQRYPDMKRHVNMNHDGTGGERIVTIHYYYSKTTCAALYGSELIYGPAKTPYEGYLPFADMTFQREPSVAHPTGSAEKQIGSLTLLYRLQQAWRETILRSPPVGVLSGQFMEGDVDALLLGEESTILRAKTPNSVFDWKTGAEVSNSSIALGQKIQQNMNAESGVNDFQRSQTDVNVDFASQLSFMAAQSGVQGRYTAQRFEEGVKDALNLLCRIGKEYAPPVQLYIGDEQYTFDEMMPIREMLGDDGQIVIAPGGMEYKSPAQKLQEAAMFAQTLAAVSGVPAPIQERYIEMVLDAFGIDGVSDWMSDMKESRKLIAPQMNEAQSQDMGMMAQGV